MNEIEKAIEELQSLLIAGINGADLEMFGLISEESFSLAILALEKQLTNAWIPCSERLPNEDECNKNSNQFIVTCESHFDDEPNWTESCIFDDLADGYINPMWETGSMVIAWQSLPHPYEVAK